MELSNYLDTVRDQIARASALADEPTQQVAHKLSASVDSALRLSLIQALADAAAEISAELAPSSVELRMSGSDPEFVVHQVPTPAAYAEENDDAALPDAETAEESDEPQARLSLRIPASVKKRIDDVAAREQISTNAWITRAVLDQLRRGERGPGEGRGGRERRRRGRGGWGGPMGPFGPGPLPPFPPGPPQAGTWGNRPRGYQGWV